MAHLESTAPKPFRVIIVGGGIVGLSLSHAFQLANIEHVVLEKHDKIISIRGAALIVWPSAARIIDQFGFLDKIHKTSTPITNESRRWPDGTLNSRARAASKIAELFDTPSVLMDRERLVTYLYDNLTDRSKVLTSKRVDQIEHTSSGVRVVLSDGSSEEGDMVVGADGVHSVIREQMWDYASKSEPNTIPESDKSAMFTEFAGLIGVSPLEESYGLGPSDWNVIYGQDACKLLFTQQGTVYWGIVFKIELSRPPKRQKASKEDMAAVAERYLNTSLTETLRFSELWDNKLRCGLLNIEEGVLSKWHAGRIVLVGDSAQKMTADLGIGANLGLEAVATLSNILHRELKSNPNRHPSTSELSAIFAEYQNNRYDRTKGFSEDSGEVTRMNTWQGVFRKYFICYIAPYLNPWRTRLLATDFANAPKLDFAPLHIMNEDTDGWKLAKKKKKAKAGAGWMTYVLLTSTIGVAVAFVAKQGLSALF